MEMNDMTYIFWVLKSEIIIQCILEFWVFVDMEMNDDLHIIGPQIRNYYLMYFRVLGFCWYVDE